MYFALLYFMPLIAIVAFFWLLVTGSRSAFFCTLATSSFALAVWLSFVWLLRDGLAPGYVPSSGATAAARFINDATLPAAVWLVIALASCTKYIFSHKRVAAT